MTAKKQNPANFAVFSMDRYGYPHFAYPGFYTEGEANAIRANLEAKEPGSYRVENLGWYKRNQDPDTLSEKELRRRNGHDTQKPKSVVITGTIEGMTRQEAKAYLAQRGYKVVTALSSATDYLITGDKPGAKKVKQASDTGVKVMPWNEVA